MAAEISEQEGERSRRYARAKNVFRLLDLAVGVLFLVLMLLLFSRPLARAAGAPAAAAPGALAVLWYFAAFLAGFHLFTLPLAWLGGHRLECRYGLSRQTGGAWFKRSLKAFLVSLAISLLLLEGLYLLIGAFPRWWWLPAAAGYFLFTVVLGRLFPVLILPLFYKLEPLEAPELSERLGALAAGTGLTLAGIYRLDLSRETVKANAGLAGLGRSRRVILGDTLLDNFTPAEIDVVFAHEVGHHVKRHISRLIALSALAAAAGLFLARQGGETLAAALGFAGGLADLAAFPVLALALMALGLLLMPFQAALSRHFERQADRWALERTNDPAAFIGAMERLAELNLAERRPSRLVELLFHDHPPLDKRIEMARRYEAGAQPCAPTLPDSDREEQGAEDG